MASILIGAGVLNQTPLDWSGNRWRILQAIRSARRQRVQILLLPELAISGYGCEDAFFSPDVWTQSEQCLEHIIQECLAITVVVGLPVFQNGHLYNCVAVIQNKKIIGLNAKKNLPREGVHYEYRWFEPFPKGEVMQINFAKEKQVPFGDLYYRFGSIGVGIEICEEAWSPTSASASIADRCHIVLCPSASHFALGKVTSRETLVANASRSLSAHYIYTNLLGCEAGRIIYDGGALFAHGGQIADRGNRFGFYDWSVWTRECDITQISVNKARSKAVSLPQTKHIEPTCIEGSPLKISKQWKNPHRTSIQSGSLNEDFLRALQLGLFDYLRKSKSKGFVISLSGGLDSAICAVLVAASLKSAWQQLGAQEFAKKLSLKKVPKRLLLSDFLHCIYQKTDQSSQKTHNLAKKLAATIGVELHTVDISSLCETYIVFGQNIVKRKLSWSRDDITLQNIQARVRAPMAWLLANIHNAILITTSNRSEGATGYATMDGDMAGGLAPIAGIDKHFLRHWAHWAARDRELTKLFSKPLDILQEIADQPPTAELRPQKDQQQDEKDLMPYEILAFLEKSILRDHTRHHEVLAQLKKMFPNRQSVKRDLEKFESLFASSQWKRERLAPSFHIDDMSVDSRGWLRYPIFSR